MNKRNMVRDGGSESATVSLLANDSLDITILVDPEMQVLKQIVLIKEL